MSNAETNETTLFRQRDIPAKFGERALRPDDLYQILTEACLLVGERLGTERVKGLELQALRERPGAQRCIHRAAEGIARAGAKRTEGLRDGSTAPALNNATATIVPVVEHHIMRLMKM